MTILEKHLRTIKEFIEKKNNTLEEEYDTYAKLETYIVDKSPEIDKLENEEIFDLGGLMQDQIAEMEYMEDNSQYIAEIKKIYERMQEIYKSMQNN